MDALKSVGALFTRGKDPAVTVIIHDSNRHVYPEDLRIKLLMHFSEILVTKHDINFWLAIDVRYTGRITAIRTETSYTVESQSFQLQE